MPRGLVFLIATIGCVILVSFFISRYRKSCCYTYHLLRNTPSRASYPQNSTVGVIGGGLAGMYVSELIKKNHQVFLFEKESRLGGNNYSSKYGIPMRFGVFYHRSSPSLMKLIKKLHLKEIYADSRHITPRIDGEFKSFHMGQILTFFLFVYLPTIFRYFFSESLENKLTNEVFSEKNYMYKYGMIPTAGINLFADRKDVGALPASQMSNYICKLLYNQFKCIEGGNDILIKRLYSEIVNKVHIETDYQAKRVRLDTFSSGVIVDNKVFDSVILSCQPHQAQNILDKTIEPHQSIFKCFTTVKSFSCVHTFHKVFQGIPENCYLAYDTHGPHHYLHIDAYYYTLPNYTEKRKYIITCWYDSAPNIIPRDYILENSFTILSRPIAEKQGELNRLLIDMKTNHQNIHLCNAAYYGFMWHEDACAIAESVSKAYHFDI